MQCPNCQKIEKGQWLYANGCQSYPEFSMDEWTHDEDLYDVSYSEMSFGVHWCPFGNLTRLPSSFEYNMIILLCTLLIVVNGPTLCFGYKVEDKILKVQEELWKETIPLQGGSRFYQLQGLKPHTWYEVKISYPASIPASFYIQLKRNKADVVLNNNRRLLNTEKLIFKTSSNQDEFQLVLVTVEPEGFPAKPQVVERQFIIFNIVCDELLLGIPYKAWWVVALALLCLGIAFVVPSFLPLYLLPKNQSREKFLN